MKKNITKKLSKATVFLMAFMALTMVFTMYSSSIDPVIQEVVKDTPIENLLDFDMLNQSAFAKTTAVYYTDGISAIQDVITAAKAETDATAASGLSTKDATAEGNISINDKSRLMRAIRGGQIQHAAYIYVSSDGAGNEEKASVDTYKDSTTQTNTKAHTGDAGLDKNLKSGNSDKTNYKDTPTDTKYYRIWLYCHAQGRATASRTATATADILIRCKDASSPKIDHDANAIETSANVYRQAINYCTVKSAVGIEKITIKYNNGNSTDFVNYTNTNTYSSSQTITFDKEGTYEITVTDNLGNNNTNTITYFTSAITATAETNDTGYVAVSNSSSLNANDVTSETATLSLMGGVEYYIYAISKKNYFLAGWKLDDGTTISEINLEDCSYSSDVWKINKTTPGYPKNTYTWKAQFESISDYLKGGGDSSSTFTRPYTGQPAEFGLAKKLPDGFSIYYKYSGADLSGTAYSKDTPPTYAGHYNVEVTIKYKLGTSYHIAGVGNYTLEITALELKMIPTFESLTVNVGTKEVTYANAKIYDGKLDAPLQTGWTYAINDNDADTKSIASKDGLMFTNVEGASFTYNDKGAGTNKSITVNATATISSSKGASVAKSYTFKLGSTTNLKGTITPRELTVSALGYGGEKIEGYIGGTLTDFYGKIYDGSTAATLSGVKIEGFVIIDGKCDNIGIAQNGVSSTNIEDGVIYLSLNANFGNKKASTKISDDRKVTASGLTLVGDDKGNYYLTNISTNDTNNSITAYKEKETFSISLENSDDYPLHIGQREVSIKIIEQGYSKIYDGTTNPSSDSSIQFTWVNINEASPVQSGDRLYIDPTSATIAYSSANANYNGKTNTKLVDNDLTITVTGLKISVTDPDNKDDEANTLLSNYHLTNSTASITRADIYIITRLLTVTITAEGKVYDGTTSAKTSYTTDAYNKDGITVSYTATFEDKDVGQRTATAYGLKIEGDKASNYHLSATTLTAKNQVYITQKSIENVNFAKVEDLPYIGSAYTPEPTVTDKEINGGTELIKGTDFTYSYLNNTNAGPYTITVTGAGNYTGTASTEANIVKANVKISDIKNIGIVYGQSVTANASIKATAVNAGNEDLTVDGYWSFVSDVKQYPLVADAGEKIIQFTPADLTNYNLPAENSITLTVDKRPIEITAIAQSMTYGNTISFNNTSYTPEAFDADNNRGRFSTDTFGTLTCEITSKIYSATASNKLMAGEYDITGEYIGNDNYDITFVSAIFTVNKRSLSIKVTPLSKIYGEPDPAIEYTVESGYFDNMPLQGELSRVEGEDVNYYNTTDGTLADDPFNAQNYIISITHTRLQITRREVIIIPDSVHNYFGEKIVIDSTAFGVSAVAGVEASGVAERDSSTPLAELFTLNIVRTTEGFENQVLDDNTSKTVGTYDLFVKTGATAANKNYTIKSEVGKYYILPRPIIITPISNQSKVYDGEDTNDSLSYSVAPNNDSLSSASVITGTNLVGALVREAGADAGSYLINQGTLSNDGGRNPNYAITFSDTPVYYTIEQREVTVTPTMVKKNFGEALPTPAELKFTMTSLGDRTNVISNSEKGVKGGLTLPQELYDTENAGNHPEVGVYDIIADSTMRNTAINANYIITVVGGSKFEISKLTALIKPVAGQSIVFGTKVTFGTEEGNLNLKFTAVDKTYPDRVIAPETINSEFTGALEIEGYSVNTEHLLTAGNYRITIGTLNGGDNYAVELDESVVNFTVDKKSIILVVAGGENLQRIYGNDEKDIVFGVSNDTPVVEGYPLSDNKLTRVAGENVGSYEVMLPVNFTADNRNYAFDFDTTYYYEISARPIIIIPSSGASSIYGYNDNAINYTTKYFYEENPNGTLDGLLSTNGILDTLGGSLSRASGVDVGEYAINIGSLNNPSAAGYNKNYTVQLQKETVYYNVTRRAVTVSAKNVEQIFGEEERTLDVTYSIGGLTYGATSLIGYPEREKGDIPGKYTINQGTMTNLENPNYDITFKTATYTITKRPITVTADAGQAKGYGEDDPIFTYTVTRGSTQITGEPIVSGLEPGIILTRAEGETPASYNFSFKEDESNVNNQYYNITFVAKNTFTINRGQAKIAFNDGTVYNEESGRYELTLSYNGDNQSVDAYLEVGDDSISLTYRVNGRAGNQFKDKGNYTVQITANPSSLFVGTSVDVYVTVNPCDLGAIDPKAYVNESDLVKTYGEKDASDYKFTVEGLNGDEIHATMVREEGENAGKYDFLSITLDNENYSVSFIDGSNVGIFEIEQRAITLAPTLKTKTYGAEEKAITEIVVDDNGETITVTYTREEGENAGEYNLVSFSLSSANHVASWEENAGEKKFVILRRNATVTATAIRKVFDGEAVDLDTLSYNYKVTGVVNGESLAGSITIESSAENGAPINAGTYNIVAVGFDDQEPVNRNYKITYIGAVCEITPAPIVITPIGAEYEYGDTIAPFTYEIRGTVYEGYELEGELGVLTNLSMGNHPIPQGTLDNADGRNANYRITYAGVGVYCTITARHITIKPESATQVYGDEITPILFTVTEGSLVEGDVLKGSFGITGTKVGKHDITIGNLQAFNRNYEITLDSEDAVYTITARPITVKADAKNTQYGDKALTLTYTAEGLIDGDTLEGSLECKLGVNVNSYAITKGTLKHNDYEITFEGAYYTITPREIEITIRNAESEYGAVEAALTYTVTKGSVLEGDDLKVTLQREEGTAMGFYQISGSHNNNNYNVTFIKGIYTIKKYQAVISVETAHISFVEDGVARSIQATCSSGAEITYTINHEKVMNRFKTAGKYTVELNAPETDYYYAPKSVTVYITINRPVITATANGIDVTITNDDGFDPNMSIEMEKLPTDYMDMQAELTSKQKIVRAFNLTSISESGLSEEVAGKTTVTIKVPTMLADQNVVQIMVREDGVYSIIDVKPIDGYVTFEVDSLSSFAFITEESNNSLILIIIGIAAAIMLGSLIVFLFKKRA